MYAHPSALWRVAARRARARPRVLALCTLTALSAAATLCACAHARSDLHTRVHFPAHAPAAVAHLLADFSTQPHTGRWRVLSDRSNYTWWRYAVAFECGAHCTGRAAVSAHQLLGVPLRHGPAPRHHVRVTRRTCTALPALPLFSFCDELETSAEVKSDGAGGALLEETAHAHCSTLTMLAGACGAELRAHRDLRVQRLRLALG